MTTTKEKSPEVAKYLAKKEKAKEVVKKKPEFKRIFNFIDLTSVVNKVATIKKVKPKTTTKYKHTSAKELGYVLPTIFETTELQVNPNSIRKFLNECHSDVQTLINKNEFKSIKATCDDLTVITRNNLRIIICALGEYERKITITHKKELLFEGKTVVKFIKEKI